MIRISLIRVALLVFVSSGCLFAAETSPQVTLNASKVNPREVETLTQRSIIRDYKFAWTNFDLAMESNSAVPLNGLFVGDANARLNAAVSSQKNNGLSSRYLNQSHKLEAVFYAPEGDVLELHDTAEYDLEILDGNKTIHSEHAIVHYIVLMTPGADRWVIRHLQEVPRF